MKMPHTHYTKGKTVWVRLKNGEEHVGRFVETKGRFVVLENRRFETWELKAMGYRRHEMQRPRGQRAARV